MRLIDADALLEYLDKRRTYEVMDGRNKAYGKGVRDAMKDIENAPTIDSIPVEWLKQQFYDNPKSQWAEKCRDVYTKWQKWQRLQKEQEA